MEYCPFPALLCSGDNSVREFGRATIAQHDNAIDFTGDFVPLLPLGAQARIQWVLGEKILAELNGKVYLSSRELLRLVELEPAVLEQLKDIFKCNIHLAAQIIPAEKAMFAKQIATQATVLYLSQTDITICSSEYVGEGEQLLVSAEVDFLTLHQLPVTVEKRVLLRRGEALLLCKVQRGSNDNFIALAAFATRLEEQEKKQAKGR